MFFTHILAAAPLQFTITTSEIIYVIIAAVVGLVAEFIVGWRLPFGIVGAIIAALIGIWLVTSVIAIIIPGDFVLNIAGQSIPLLRALLGAIVVVAIWHLLTYPTWRRRERYYRGYRRGYRERY